jgi:hypothetical protein
VCRYTVISSLFILMVQIDLDPGFKIGSREMTSKGTTDDRTQRTEERSRSLSVDARIAEQFSN